MNLRVKKELLRDVDLICRDERGTIIGLCFVLFCSAIMEAVGVFSVMPFMAMVSNPGIIHENEILARVYVWGGFSSDRSFLLATGMGVLILLCLSTSFSAFTLWRTTSFANQVNHRLSMKLLSAYLGKPYLFFVQNGTADIGTNIVSEVGTFTTGFLRSCLDLLAKAFVVAVLCGMLLGVNPQVALQVTIASVLIYGFLAWVTKAKMGRYGSVRLKAKAAFYRLVHELFSAIREVKLYNSESRFTREIESHSSHLAQSNSLSVMIAQLPKFALELFGFGTLLILVLLQISSGNDMKAILPILSLYAIAGYRLLPALQGMFASLTQARYNLPSVGALRAHIKQQPTPASAPTLPMEELRFERELVIDIPHFNYPGSQRTILEGVKVSVRKNESIAVVGPTGSGKSTLLDILCGLVRPEQGGILIDGLLMDSDGKVAAWQKKIGYVSQYTYMLDDTILANVAFGCTPDQVDTERARQALRAAQILDFVESELPEGIVARIGERGARLSGGQRQRIGIARALYRNPELLILDEATSALDRNTEARVLEAIKKMLGNKTIFMITHQMVAIEEFSLILFLNRGRIAAQGSFKTLLANTDFTNFLKAEPEIRDGDQGTETGLIEK